MQKPQLPCQDWTILRKGCLMVLVIWAGFSGVKAQSSEIEFKGIILDSATQKPIAYAFINVLDSIGGVTYSNVNGEFIFKLKSNDLAKDSLSVSVEYPNSKKVNRVLFANIKEEILLVLIPDDSLKKVVKSSCSGKTRPHISKGLKPKPFLGFGTKFLE